MDDEVGPAVPVDVADAVDLLHVRVAPHAALGRVLRPPLPSFSRTAKVVRRPVAWPLPASRATITSSRPSPLTSASRASRMWGMTYVRAAAPPARRRRPE